MKVRQRAMAGWAHDRQRAAPRRWSALSPSTRHASQTTAEVAGLNRRLGLAVIAFGRKGSSDKLGIVPENRLPLGPAADSAKATGAIAAIKSIERWRTKQD